jgi:hypothetical protein
MELERVVTGPDGNTQILLNTGKTVWVGPVDRLQLGDGHITFDGHSDAAEVVRLYATMLDRNPDQAGLVFWSGKMAQGTDLLDAIKGFLNSAEFITRFGGMTDKQLVSALYREALGREPEAGGLAWHVQNLAHGASRAETIKNFITSDEAAKNFEAEHPGGLWVPDPHARLVGMAYDAVFDRAPDAGGLKYWAEKLAAGTDVRQLVEAIATSTEFQNRHAAESDAAYVKSIYFSALERNPDEGGLAYWTKMLANHTVDRVEVVLLIGLSDEQAASFKHEPTGDAFHL